jgi:HD-like signal output (HDOD) protein
MEIAKLNAGITARMLKMCNFPIYRLRKEVPSLHQGMVLLGSNQLLESLFSRELSGTLPARTGVGYCLVKGELWQHSMACARLARHTWASARALPTKARFSPWACCTTWASWS